MPHTLPVDAPTLQELEAAALVIGRLEGVAVAMASIQHAAGLQDAGIGNAQIARGMNGGGGGHGRARDASEGIKGIQTLNQGQKKKDLSCILRRQVFRSFPFVLAATSKSIWREYNLYLPYKTKLAAHTEQNS
jgi:hypothetical protein